MLFCLYNAPTTKAYVCVCVSTLCGVNVSLSFFRYYFQLLATEVVNAQGFFGIINHFGWKRVGIISQDENLFTEVSITVCIMYTVHSWHTQALCMSRPMECVYCAYLMPTDSECTEAVSK